MMLAGGWLYAAEPFLKSIAAPIGLSIELYFDSKDGFRCAGLNCTCAYKSLAEILIKLAKL